MTTKQVETAKFDGFGKNLWFTVLLMTANGSKKTKRTSFYKFQADNQRRKQAITANDLRAFLSKTTPKLLKSLALNILEKLHHLKLGGNAVPPILFFALTKSKVWLRRAKS